MLPWPQEILQRKKYYELLPLEQTTVGLTSTHSSDEDFSQLKNIDTFVISPWQFILWVLIRRAHRGTFSEYPDIMTFAWKVKAYFLGKKKIKYHQLDVCWICPENGKGQLDWLCWGLTTHQSMWVILYCLPEKGRKETEEIVEEVKEKDSEERGTGMKVKK